MHRFIGTYANLPLVAMCALLLGAAEPSGDRFVHTVAAGESVSLICIDYYGYYTDSLGRAVLELNPAIKNINIILAGQRITLRKPVERTERRTAASDASRTVAQLPDSSGATVLFEKRVSITQGVVTCVDGTAEWGRSAAAPLAPLKINTIVVPGTVIKTGANGRVEIIINRESVVRIRENSRVVLESFRAPAEGTDKTRIGCGAGTIWTKMKKFRDRISRFELELPTAIAGVHGTVYESSVGADSAAEVKVFSGEVAVRNASPRPTIPEGAPGVSEVPGPHEVAAPAEVSMEQWTRIVGAMQKLSIDKNGKAATPVAFETGTPSDWEQWNRQRDERIATIFGEADAGPEGRQR